VTSARSFRAEVDMHEALRTIPITVTSGVTDIGAPEVHSEPAPHSPNRLPWISPVAELHERLRGFRLDFGVPSPRPYAHVEYAGGAA
jgi:hypothetical protein